MNENLLKLWVTLVRLYKKVYFFMWKKKNGRRGNVHLPANSANIVNIPFSKYSVFIRPTHSDVGRVFEYLSDIYISGSYLHEALEKFKPTTLIDIGANIGLSSLNLIGKFSSLKHIIAIEAEKENFSILENNFRLWKNNHENLKFSQLNAVATNESGKKIFIKNSLAEITGKNSASGTFRFGREPEKGSKKIEVDTIAISELFQNISEEEVIIVKIDIEGGEEELLENNIEWIKRCHYLTIEVHDKFDPIMLESSRNLIKIIHENNFAVVPSKDVLHLYNRDLLFKN